MRSKITLTDGTIQHTTPICEGVWEKIYGIYAVEDKVDGIIGKVEVIGTPVSDSEIDTMFES